MSVYLYILRCRDGSYYVGIAHRDLERRLAQHEQGTFDGWTAKRRPLEFSYVKISTNSLAHYVSHSETKQNAP